MDPADAIDRLASGEAVSILATAVVALAITAVVLFRRLSQVQDQRIEDMRIMGQEARQMLDQTNRALGALSEPVQEVVRELRTRK